MAAEGVAAFGGAVQWGGEPLPLAGVKSADGPVGRAKRNDTRAAVRDVDVRLFRYTRLVCVGEFCEVDRGALCVRFGDAALAA